MSTPEHQARPHAQQNARQLFTTALKVLVTVVVAYLVLRKVPLDALTGRLRLVPALDWFLLALLTVAQVSVGVLRWQRLLRRLGERVSFLELYGDVLVGLMFNMFLPTTIGGDVVRALRASKRVTMGHGHRAWSSSIYERVAGLLVMAGSGALAAAVAIGLLGLQLPDSVRWLALGIAALFVVAFVFASWPFRLLVRTLERRLPTAAEDVQGIVRDLEGPLASAPARLETLGWSILYQGLGIGYVIVGAMALGAPGHAVAISIGVPLVHVLSLAPVSLGGLGYREGLFVAVLRPLGVPSDVALGLALQWLLSCVGFALAGVVVWWAVGKSPAARDTTPTAAINRNSP